MVTVMNLLAVDKTKEHYSICKTWLEDKEITKWLTSILRFSKYHNIIHQMLISNSKNKLFFINVDGEPIGLIGFLNIDHIDKKAEIWYIIGSKRDRGKNIATEALSLLKEIATKDLGVVCLYAQVSQHNWASIRVLEKNGFEYAGKLRKAFSLDDSYTDLLLFDWICN